MLKITTESGRSYLLDDSFWLRLPKSEQERPMAWEKVWRLERGTHFAHPWDSPEGTWEAGQPEVGKFMHIGSRDLWWTSTMVVAIEEIDSEDDI